VTLVPLAAAHIEQLRSWRNREDVRVWFDDPRIVEADGQRAWFERYVKRDDDAMFVILGGDAQEPVGAVALYDIGSPPYEAEFGRLMIGVDSARGSGVALEASRLLCRWGFDALSLRAIRLSVRRDNPRATSLYERLGFRMAAPAADRPDHHHMILRSDNLVAEAGGVRR
jgi:RimJ/RimL family protein N-acetyltransferase